jgi:hypothetical protein
MAMTSNGKIYPEERRKMKNDPGGLMIPLQVGTELRIKNNGEIRVDNPELELAGQTSAADAVLSYRFDAELGEHILRLLDPVADLRHLRVHRRGD